jgi:hypothetical protein
MRSGFLVLALILAIARLPAAAVAVEPAESDEKPTAAAWHGDGPSWFRRSARGGPDPLQYRRIGQSQACSVHGLGRRDGRRRLPEPPRESKKTRQLAGDLAGGEVPGGRDCQRSLHRPRRDRAEQRRAAPSILSRRAAIFRENSRPLSRSGRRPGGARMRREWRCPQ